MCFSSYPIEKLKNFSVEECRNKFSVASASPKMITGYDVKLAQRDGLSNRTSYVIAQNGRIAFVHSDLSPSDHVKTTLAAVKSLGGKARSEEHTSELQSLMRISYAVFCLKKKKHKNDKGFPTN